MVFNMKNSRVIIGIALSMVVSFYLFGVFFASETYASVGAEFRASAIIENAEVPEFNEVEFAKYQAEAEKKDFWFTAPSDYSKQFSSRVDSKRMFVSDVNPYDASIEWKAMSVPERVAVSQIPEDKLKSLQTEELIMHCMNVNMMGDMYAFNNLQEGFDRLVLRYNSLQWMQNKEDSGSEFLRLYKAINLFELSEIDRISTIRLSFLEMAIAQDCVLETLTDEECRGLIIECFNKAKQISDVLSGHFSTASTIYLGIKCLYKYDSAFAEIVDSSEALTTFVKTSVLNLDDVDDNTLGRVVVHFQDNYLGG